MPQGGAEYDDPFDTVFHKTIKGLSGLPGDMVRPRWQPDPPNQPPVAASWVAFGVTSIEPDKNAYLDHTLEGTYVERDEQVTVTLSFYGPQAMSLAQRFVDGIELSQNRADLREQGVAVLYAQNPVQVPALLQGTWRKKVDVQLLCARRTRRLYPVNTIESAGAGLDNEHWVTPLTVEQP